MIIFRSLPFYEPDLVYPNYKANLELNVEKVINNIFEHSRSSGILALTYRKQGYRTGGLDSKHIYVQYIYHKTAFVTPPTSLSFKANVS